MLRRSFFAAVAALGLFPWKSLKPAKAKTLMEVLSEAADSGIFVSATVFDSPGFYRAFLAAASGKGPWRMATDTISDKVWQQNTPAQREALVVFKIERLVKCLLDERRDSTDPKAFGYPGQMSST